MSQFLIVQGSIPEQVQEVFSTGLKTFEDVAGMRPQGCHAIPGKLAVASFASLVRGSVPIHTAAQWWSCQAGSLFWDRRAGAPAANAFLDQFSGTPPEGLPHAMRAADGSFAVGIGRGDGSFWVITDRIGTIHVYHSRMSGCTVVSTSSLVLAAMMRPSWDRIGCREFLATGTVFSMGRTLFEGIEKLGPASIFEYREGGDSSRRVYWDCTEFPYDDRVGSVPALADALTDTIATIAKSLPHPVLDLTGGFDSRALLGAALRSGTRFETVVVGTAGSADVEIAGAIAKEFGVAHHHVPDGGRNGNWWQLAKDSMALCDGEYNVLEYAGILGVHRRMAQSHDCSLNGSYGELCRGLFWELLMPFTGSPGHFDVRRLAVKRYAEDGELEGLLAQKFDTSLEEHFTHVIEEANAGLEGRPNTLLIDNNTVKVYAQRWQGRIASATNRLWPALAPFLWRRPLEVALSAPPRVRVRARMARRLIEYLHPRLAEIQTSHGYPALPLRPSTAHRFAGVGGIAFRRLIGRARTAFGGTATPPPSPVQALWVEEEVRDLMNPECMRSAGLYTPAVLKRFVQKASTPDFSEADRFGRLLTLEMTARVIVRGERLR